jgi:UDP-glucose 4-epimerase
MKNVLITGATGFIGQRLVRAIDANIRIISRKNNLEFDTVVCNFENESIPINSLNGIDTIFHLAGLAHDSRDASKIADLYHKVNVDASINLAKNAVKNGVERFIFISSIKAGGNPAIGKCKSELDQDEPQEIYGETKRKAELKLLEIGADSNMHVSIIRSSLVYGPNVKGNLKLLISGIKKGWFPSLPETNNMRSMIHVDDLVRAILFIAENDSTNGEIFIATDGISYSSREIYESICHTYGKRFTRFRVPKILFNIVSLISPSIKYKIDKLFGDECYTSEKLKRLGFKTEKLLKDINETSF